MPDPNDQAFFYMRWNDSEHPLNANDNQESRMLAAEFHGDAPVDEELISPQRSEIDSGITAGRASPIPTTMPHSHGQDHVYITYWHNWPDDG